MNEQSNPDLPTLQAWRVTNAAPANRFVFERNPYYHRVDAEGQQLPYVDRIVMDVAAAGLLAAKANAGEADLLFRGLSMGDIPILKEGERAKGYKTLLWPNARGTELALYPEPQHGRSGLARAQPRRRASAARCRSASTARPSTTPCCSASARRATTPSWRRARCSRLSCAR